MTPKQIAKKLIKECDDVHERFSGVAIPGESSFCVNTETWKLRYLATAYLKAVEALEVCKQFEPFPNPKVKSFIQSITVGDPHPVWISPATDFIREMGES